MVLESISYRSSGVSASPTQAGGRQPEWSPRGRRRRPLGRLGEYEGSGEHEPFGVGHTHSANAAFTARGLQEAKAGLVLTGRFGVRDQISSRCQTDRATPVGAIARPRTRCMRSSRPCWGDASPRRHYGHRTTTLADQPPQPTPAPRDPASQRTWNSPEQIAEHRGLTPAQRLREAIELSRAALRFAQAGRVDER